MINHERTRREHTFYENGVQIFSLVFIDYERSNRGHLYNRQQLLKGGADE